MKIKAPPTVGQKIRTLLYSRGPNEDPHFCSEPRTVAGDPHRYGNFKEVKETL